MQISYFFFGAFSGKIVFFFSNLIRLELYQPENPILKENFQYYITAYAFIMIFFIFMPTLIKNIGNRLVPLILGVSVDLAIGFFRNSKEFLKKHA
jgi:heme/copper-type cytochrome/quinol oxidase subunit 1